MFLYLHYCQPNLDNRNVGETHWTAEKYQLIHAKLPPFLLKGLFGSPIHHFVDKLEKLQCVGTMIWNVLSMDSPKEHSTHLLHVVEIHFSWNWSYSNSRLVEPYTGNIWKEQQNLIYKSRYVETLKARWQQKKFEVYNFLVWSRSIVLQ